MASNWTIHKKKIKLWSAVMDLDRDGPGPKERGLVKAAAALQGQG